MSFHSKSSIWLAKYCRGDDILRNTFLQLLKTFESDFELIGSEERGGVVLDLNPKERNNGHGGKRLALIVGQGEMEILRRMGGVANKTVEDT